MVAQDLIVAELRRQFFRYPAAYDGNKLKEYDQFAKTAEPLRDTCPHKPAKDFGPADRLPVNCSPTRTAFVDWLTATKTGQQLAGSLR